MSGPHVYIIIVNFRKWEDTRECIDAVLRSTYLNYSVFVVDNFSENDSLGHLSKWLNKRNAGHISEGKAQLNFKSGRVDALHSLCSPDVNLYLLQNSNNAGFASANNEVLSHLVHREGFCWLLNPDMVVQPATLGCFVMCMTGLPGKVIMGSTILRYGGNRKLITYGGFKVNFYAATVAPIKKPEQAKKMDYVSGGCLFTALSSFKTVGLLPGRYFLYWEETDWCIRARQLGFELMLCEQAICYDKGSTSIGKSFIADYYYARNGLLFVHRFKKNNLPFVLFFLSLRFVKRILTFRWSRARGIFRGTIDFFR